MCTGSAIRTDPVEAAHPNMLSSMAPAPANTCYDVRRCLGGDSAAGQSCRTLVPRESNLGIVCVTDTAFYYMTSGCSLAFLARTARHTCTCTHSHTRTQSYYTYAHTHRRTFACTYTNTQTHVYTYISTYMYMYILRFLSPPTAKGMSTGVSLAA